MLVSLRFRPVIPLLTGCMTFWQAGTLSWHISVSRAFIFIIKWEEFLPALFKSVLKSLQHLCAVFKRILLWFCPSLLLLHKNAVGKIFRTLFLPWILSFLPTLSRSQPSPKVTVMTNCIWTVLKGSCGLDLQDQVDLVVQAPCVVPVLQPPIISYKTLK